MTLRKLVTTKEICFCKKIYSKIMGAREKSRGKIDIAK